MYQNAFSILVSERIAAEQVDLAKFNQSDVELAALLSLNSEDSDSEHKTVRGKKGISIPKVTVVEIEDESWADLRKLPKSSAHILEEIVEETSELNFELQK